MSKHIKQFRFFNNTSAKNYPLTGTIPISQNSLYRGDVFNGYTPIIKLGIQSLPGTTFYINDPIKENPIVIGYTGIYELDLEGIADISTLSFNSESLKRINDVPQGYLIIDIVYDKED